MRAGDAGALGYCILIPFTWQQNSGGTNRRDANGPSVRVSSQSTRTRCLEEWRELMEWIEYGGWPRCVRLANERVELVVTTDVGPRIIRFGYRGGENVFAEFAGQVGKTG